MDEIGGGTEGRWYSGEWEFSSIMMMEPFCFASLFGVFSFPRVFEEGKTCIIKKARHIAQITHTHTACTCTWLFFFLFLVFFLTTFLFPAT